MRPLSRWFARTDVTVCIPAYQAEGFIGRTLRCAQGQTYPNLRILVSVDGATDATGEICRGLARDDRRVEVMQAGERAGWAGNVNRLLERVDTEFFFIYFHDDLILPQYCELLRGALVADPSLASVHCDLLDFGDLDALKPSVDIKGPLANRLMTLWGAPRRGTPLRSMTRLARVGPGYRLGEEAPGSFMPGFTLLMKLMAAGPAAGFPETLYLRWRRKDGLMAGWDRLSAATVAAGWRIEIQRAFDMIDGLVEAPADREALRYAVVLAALAQLAPRTRAARRRLPRFEQMHPEAPPFDPAPDFTRFGPEVRSHIGHKRRELARAWKGDR